MMKFKSSVADNNSPICLKNKLKTEVLISLLSLKSSLIVRNVFFLLTEFSN